MQEFLEDLAWFLLCSELDWRQYGCGTASYKSQPNFREYLKIEAANLQKFADETKSKLKRYIELDNDPNEETDDLGDTENYDDEVQETTDDLQFAFRDIIFTELTRIFPCIATLHADEQDNIYIRYIEHVRNWYRL